MLFRLFLIVVAIFPSMFAYDKYRIDSENQDDLHHEYIESLSGVVNKKTGNIFCINASRTNFMP